MIAFLAAWRESQIQFPLTCRTQLNVLHLLVSHCDALVCEQRFQSFGVAVAVAWRRATDATTFGFARRLLVRSCLLVCQWFSIWIFWSDPHWEAMDQLAQGDAQPGRWGVCSPSRHEQHSAFRLSAQQRHGCFEMVVCLRVRCLFVVIGESLTAWFNNYHGCCFDHSAIRRFTSRLTPPVSWDKCLHSGEWTRSSHIFTFT